MFCSCSKNHASLVRNCHCSLSNLSSLYYNWFIFNSSSFQFELMSISISRQFYRCFSFSLYVQSFRLFFLLPVPFFITILFDLLFYFVLFRFFFLFSLFLFSHHKGGILIIEKITVIFWKVYTDFLV